MLHVLTGLNEIQGQLEHKVFNGSVMFDTRSQRRGDSGREGACLLDVGGTCLLTRYLLTFYKLTEYQDCIAVCFVIALYKIGSRIPYVISTKIRHLLGRFGSVICASSNPTKKKCNFSASHLLLSAL